MKYHIILSLFVLIFTKDILLTESSRISSILKKISNKVAPKMKTHSAKKTVQTANSQINDVMRKAFASARNYRMNEYEFLEGVTVSPWRKVLGQKCRHLVVKKIENSVINSKKLFGSKITYDVHFHTNKDDLQFPEPFSAVPQRDLSNAEIGVKTDQLKISLEVKFRQETNKLQSEFSFYTTLYLEYYSLFANQTDDEVFSFDMSYKNYYAWRRGTKKGIEWSWGDLNVSSNEEDELTAKIVPLLPSLLLEHINCNPKFSLAFVEIQKIIKQYDIK